MPLKLTMTCGPYDRAQALINGTVKPEGIELDVHVNSDNPGRRTEGPKGKFDIVEFYSGLYITDLPYRTLGFTAIPIFVKRMFRHSYIYVNKRAGISYREISTENALRFKTGSPQPRCGAGVFSKRNTGST